MTSSQPAGLIPALYQTTYALRPTTNIPNFSILHCTDKTDENRLMMWVGSAAGPDNWVAMGATAATTAAIVGALSAGTTITAGTGFIATAGGLTAAAGDLAALGGFKQTIGAWTATLAASQTALGMVYGAVATVTAGWVAPSAGSILGISAFLDAAITGAGTQAAFGVYKNGTIINASAIVALTQAGAETAKSAVFAKDLYTFVANDVITMKYTSTAISNTPKAWGNIIVEC